MNCELRKALLECETDIDGALNRFAGDGEMYSTCLQAFLSDDTLEALDDALAARNWDDAFTAAHALKGLAGNMGFVPLFHSAAELVVLIRTGRTVDVPASYIEVKRNYMEVVSIIREHITPNLSETKGA